MANVVTPSNLGNSFDVGMIEAGKIHPNIDQASIVRDTVTGILSAYTVFAGPTLPAAPAIDDPILALDSVSGDMWAWDGATWVQQGGGADTHEVGSGTDSIQLVAGTNAATATFSGALAGTGNSAGSDYAVVGGGRDSALTGNYAAVGGGRDNDITTHPHGAVGGGIGQDVALSAGIGLNGAIGGGSANDAQGTQASVGGGRICAASAAIGTTVLGGENCTAAGQNYATSCGGNNTTASGLAATVAGGSLVTANTAQGAIIGSQNGNVGTGSLRVASVSSTASNNRSTHIGGANALSSGANSMTWGSEGSGTGGNEPHVFGFGLLGATTKDVTLRRLKLETQSVANGAFFDTDIFMVNRAAACGLLTVILQSTALDGACVSRFYLGARNTTVPAVTGFHLTPESSDGFGTVAAGSASVALSASGTNSLRITITNASGVTCTCVATLELFSINP